MSEATDNVGMWLSMGRPHNIKSNVPNTSPEKYRYVYHKDPLQKKVI